MKLVTFETAGRVGVGVHDGARVIDVNAGARERVNSMIELLSLGERGFELARRAVQSASLPAAPGVHAVSDVRLLAPIPRPGKIVCLGMNYADHARETGKTPPSEPVIFCKAPTSVIPPGRPILIPRVTGEIDYEVELAFVIGLRCRHVPRAEAMNVVAGYTVLNDVSARDYQNRKPGGQWFLAKSFDTFCPLGPWIVTADEIADPHALRLRCILNGRVVQDSGTGNLIFSIPRIIEYISDVFTLEVGDVVSTGTPPGVGMARKPPLWLKPGDTVRCEVDGVGALENPVAAEP